jgi:hypothetical protein
MSVSKAYHGDRLRPSGWTADGRPLFDPADPWEPDVMQTGRAFHGGRGHTQESLLDGLPPNDFDPLCEHTLDEVMDDLLMTDEELESMLVDLESMDSWAP